MPAKLFPRRLLRIEQATDADLRPAAEVAVRSLRWTEGATNSRCGDASAEIPLFTAVQDGLTNQPSRMRTTPFLLVERCKPIRSFTWQPPDVTSTCFQHSSSSSSMFRDLRLPRIRAPFWWPGSRSHLEVLVLTFSALVAIGGTCNRALFIVWSGVSVAKPWYMNSFPWHV